MARIIPARRRQDAVDAVVIGSGAGGGVVAKELAEAGLRVVVLEAGPRYDPSEYPATEPDFELRDSRVFLNDPARDRVTSGTGRDFSVSAVKGVGGSTLRYLGVSPRFHESDFRTRSTDGVGDDWPIAYEDLEPHYTRVEYELGVSGPSDSPFEPPRSRPFPTPPHPLNCAARAVKRGADRLGLHLEPPALAIPTEPWDGRPACRRAGVCEMGCWWRSKSSIDVTYIPKAEATGRCEIRTRCMARRVETGRDGRAVGVVYIDAEGTEREVRGRVVVIAGNAIETPRLLLLSESGAFPNGLANSSGLVGRRLMEHVGIGSLLRFPGRVEAWKGPSALAVLRDHYETDPGRDYARGFTLEVSGGRTWPFHTSKEVGGWGAEHKAGMARLFGHNAKLASVGEQLPDPDNRVELDPDVTDRYGLPVPRITFEIGENERAMYRTMRRVHDDLAEAAGAEVLRQVPHGAGQSSHYMGTCRMGTDPRTSVVDPRGRAHDVPNLFIADGSVFVTGAAVNPALTISALADRTAGAIVEALRSGEIS